MAQVLFLIVEDKRLLSRLRQTLADQNVRDIKSRIRVALQHRPRSGKKQETKHKHVRVTDRIQTPIWKKVKPLSPSLARLQELLPK